MMALDDLLEFRDTARKNGQKVVFTNGCFDILHAGHIHYLEQAKELGDILVVGLNSDSSVRQLKGPSRPIVPEDDRASVLRALRVVDAVVVFAEETPISLIQQLAPDIHVKGGDYTKEELPEYDVVVAYGGQVIILPFIEGKSSSLIIERIKGLS